MGERRLPADAGACEWLDAEDLIIEVIELHEADEPPAELTRIAIPIEAPPVAVAET